MMSTQNQADHGVIQSSIALLQERFKQLQRVKEMREKKQLLTMFSDNYQINHATTIPNNSTTTTNNNNNNDLGDVVDVNDDEVQIFLPPNYYCSNPNKASSCYYSSSTSSSLSLSSSSSSSLLNNNKSNVNEITLSLWPPAMSSYTNATVTGAEQFRRARIETPLSTAMSTTTTRPSSCISSACNRYEDYPHHVSDVDTTLHL